MTAKNTTKNAEIFAPVAAPVKAPRRRAAKKTAVAAAVAAVTAAAPAIIQAAAPASPAPAIIQAAAPASPAPAIIQAAAPVAAAGFTWAKTLPRKKNEGTNLFSFRHGFEFTAIDGKIKFVKPQLAFSMDDLKAIFGLSYAKYIKANLLSYAARFVSESGPTRNYIWLFSDILKFAGSTKNRKTIKQAVRTYYNNQING